MPVQLQAEARTNGQTARAIIEQDVDGDGVPEYVETVDLEDGEREYELSTFVEDESASYNMTLDLESSDPTTSAEILSPVTISVGIVAASGVTVTETEDGSVDISWERPGSADRGGWKVFKSEDGSLGQEIADLTNPTSTNYTDTAVLQGRDYYYTVRRYDSEETKDASQQHIQTELPNPSSFGYTRNIDDTVTFTWLDNSTDEEGIRLLESNDAGETFDVRADLDPDTERYTTEEIDNINDRQYKVVAFTDDTTAESDTATLPASAEGYASDGNFDQWARHSPTEPVETIEQGDGTGSSSAVPGLIVNEDMDVLDEQNNSMYATAGDGSQHQGIPLPGDDTRGRHVTYVQELDPTPDAAWPLRVDTQLTVQLEDLDKLSGFDASVNSECDASVTVDSVEEITGTNEVNVNLTATYNCPEISDDETIDSVTTVQPKYDGNYNSGVTGGYVRNPEVSDGNGNDAGSGTSGDVTWGGGSSGWSPTRPPKLDIGHDCSPIEDGIKVPLKIYYRGSDTEPIYSYTTKIDYDQDVLEFAGFEDPSEEHPDYEVMSQITAEFPDEDNGAIKFRAYGDFAFKPWRSDHLNTVTYLKFNIVGDNGDSSHLNFVETYEEDDPDTYWDESFFANSPFVGERPTAVGGEYGDMVSWSEQYYGSSFYSTRREDWRPFRFSNGGASVGNGVNIQANDTEIGERTKVEISMDATTRVSGYDITIGYPAEDSNTPFRFITADSGDLEDNITVRDEYDRGLVHISASDEAADIDYDDPVLANLYFEPVSVYDESSDLSIQYVTGDIWDVNTQAIRVDCTSEANLTVDNSQEIRPTESNDVPEGESISGRYTVDVPEETVDVNWPIIMNQTFTINGAVTDNLKNIKVEFNSSTNPDIEWVKNDWWVVDEDTAAVNATLTFPEAEDQQYPPTFYPMFEFVWGAGTTEGMNGYINQSSNLMMGASATSGNGGSMSISIRPGLPPNWSRSENGEDE